jgi:hypothetical protein
MQWMLLHHIYYILSQAQSSQTKDNVDRKDQSYSFSEGTNRETNSTFHYGRNKVISASILSNREHMQKQIQS